MLTSELRPYVAGRAANCPNPAIDRALVDAARSLCEAAPVWLGTVEVTATDVTAVGDKFRVDLRALYVGEGSLSRVQHTEPFCRYEQPEDCVILFREKPTDPVTFHVSLKPERRSAEISDTVTDSYQEGVVAGALYRVLSMPGQLWADGQTAILCAREERKVRNQAILDARRGFGQGSLSMRPRRLAIWR